MSKKSDAEFDKKITRIAETQLPGVDKDLAKSVAHMASEIHVDKLLNQLETNGPVVYTVASAATGSDAIATVGFAGVGAAISKWAFKGKAATGALIGGAVAVAGMIGSAVYGGYMAVKSAKREAHTPSAQGLLESIHIHEKLETDPTKKAQLHAAEKPLHAEVEEQQNMRQLTASIGKMVQGGGHLDKILAEKAAAHDKSPSV